jgi:hypothetical protein
MHLHIIINILGRGFFYNFIFKIKKSVSLFCASTGGLSRRYLKTNQRLAANSVLFLKGHLQVGLISICNNITDSSLNAVIQKNSGTHDKK